MKKLIALITCLSLSSISIGNETTLNHNNSNTQEKEKKIPIGNVSWKSPPRIQIQLYELEGQNREIQTQIKVDQTGRVIDVQITKSSGLTKLDQKVLRSVRKATFTPYHKNGVTKPFTASQSFSLTASESDLSLYRPKYHAKKAECLYTFDSEIWKAQHTQVTPFKYEMQPDVFIKKSDLNGESRRIDFSFKLSRKNELSKIQLIKSSGSNTIDVQVISALMYAKVSAPRKFWQFYKLNFKDSISFDLNKCN